MCYVPVQKIWFVSFWERSALYLFSNEKSYWFWTTTNAFFHRVLRKVFFVWNLISFVLENIIFTHKNGAKINKTSFIVCGSCQRVLSLAFRLKLSDCESFIFALFRARPKSGRRAVDDRNKYTWAFLVPTVYCVFLNTLSQQLFLLSPDHSHRETLSKSSIFFLSFYLDSISRNNFFFILSI